MLKKNTFPLILRHLSQIWKCRNFRFCRAKNTPLTKCIFRAVSQHVLKRLSTCCSGADPVHSPKHDIGISLPIARLSSRYRKDPSKSSQCHKCLCRLPFSILRPLTFRNISAPAPAGLQCHKKESRLRDSHAGRGRFSDMIHYARVRILPEGFYLIGNRNFL